MYAEVAAIALPYILSAMQDRPDMPQYRPSASLPDRSAYLDQVLNAGFNPQTDMYRQASNIAADRMSREMSRQGLGGSSFASGAMSNTLSDLANKYMEQELERKMKAINTVTQNDLARANFQSGIDQNMYNANMAGYNDKMARLASQTQGYAGMAQAGLGLYQQNQMQNQRQANFERMMSSGRPMSYEQTFGPSYGPGYQYGG